jgi:hypothetical protein
MPWAAAGAIVSAGIGAASSHKARKAGEADARARRDDAEQSRRLGRENLQWFQDEYDRTAPTRSEAVDMAQQTSRDQYSSMQYSMGQAKEAEQRRKGIFEPLEDRIVKDAFAFDDKARGEQLAGQATADLNQAFAGVRGQSQRGLTRMGVNPNSGAFAAMTNQTNLGQALALAKGQTEARRAGRDEGEARRMIALQLGSGLRGAQAQQQQIATGQGSAAVGNAGAAVSLGQSGASLRQAGFGGMMQAYGQANNSSQLASQSQASASAWGEKQAGAYGQALGAMGQLGKSGMDMWSSMGSAVSGLSDKNKKKKTGKPADTKKALDEVMAIPVHEDWEYDESKGAPMGSGGKKYTGPMAQDVRKHMGEKAAPRGEVLDFVEINGKLMAGMQEMHKRMKLLEARA